MQAFVSISRLLAAASLFLLAGLRYGDPTWLLSRELIVLACCFAALFLVLVPLTRHYLAGKSLIAITVTVGVLSALASGVVLAVTVVGEWDVSRLMVGFETLLLFALLLLNQPNVSDVVAATANVLAFAVALYPRIADGSLLEFARLNRVRDDGSVRYLATSRHDLKVVNHALFNPALEAKGGGLARIDDQRVLLVAGDGQLVVLSPGPTGLGVLKPGLQSPLNRKEFVQGVKVANPFFRVTGVLLEARASGPRKLYVSHHHWDVARKCVTLRLSETDLDFDHLPSRLDWVSRYGTQPCLSGEDLSNASGGRLAFLDENQILMTIGNHGTGETPDLHRAYEWVYGTIIALRRSDWSVRTFTTGHRNPQGLLVQNREIWSTEHGPQGGDELNRLVEGADYGWPRSTYGTAYGTNIWPLVQGDDVHAEGVKPVYAWVPSIGVSNLIRIRGVAFPAWKSDLIVASLSALGNGYSIFRVKLDGTRVVLVERIHTGLAVRDLLEHSDGRLLLWDGSDTIQLLEPATHVFSPCSGCHALHRTTHGIGPDLMGVVGERVAHHTDYQYSQALRSLRGRWTRNRLDKFLRNPSEFAPGTTMKFTGIADEAQRATIIEYLEELDEPQ